MEEAENLNMCFKFDVGIAYAQGLRSGFADTIRK